MYCRIQHWRLLVLADARVTRSPRRRTTTLVASFNLRDEKIDSVLLEKTIPDDMRDRVRAIFSQARAIAIRSAALQTLFTAEQTLERIHLALQLPQVAAGLPQEAIRRIAHAAKGIATIARHNQRRSTASEMIVIEDDDLPPLPGESQIHLNEAPVRRRRSSRSS